MIDTLDILIADARGTDLMKLTPVGKRLINFAIRLALARPLAQRAGAALQPLIVDEGFGHRIRKLRSPNCSDNAIASDFASIPSPSPFISSLQAWIEVYKTQNGSSSCQFEQGGTEAVEIL